MRGGKRAGAGRPTIIEGQRLERRSVLLPPDLIAWAEHEGRGNLSKGLRQLLTELDQRQGAERQGVPFDGRYKHAGEAPGTGASDPPGR